MILNNTQVAMHRLFAENWRIQQPVHPASQDLSGFRGPASALKFVWGFPKIRGTFFGIPRSIFGFLLWETTVWV